MPKKLRALQAIAIVINLLVTACWFFLPQSLYFGSNAGDAIQPRDPFLAHYAPVIFSIGFLFLLMTLIFMFPRRSWLRIPIGVYSFLTVFMALAQGRAFFSNVGEGLVLFSFSVLPLALVTWISFRLGRLGTAPAL